MPSSSPVIYTFLDWRAFVDAWLAVRPAVRNRRSLARDLGCAPSFVTALLHSDPGKRRSLTDEYLERFPAALGLTPDEAEFFRLLVVFDRADERSEARDRARRQIYADKRFREAHRITVEQYDLFSQWENVAILALAESSSFQANPRWLRDHLIPPVQLQEAERAIELLLRLGLLVRGEHGRVRPAHNLIAAVDSEGADAEALRRERQRAGMHMHRWMLDRAKQVLKDLPEEDRHFTAGTQLVPASRLPELKRMFTRWQAEWMDLCKQPEPEWAPRSRSARRAERVAVFRLNLQFFPLSAWIDEEL